MSAEVRRPLSPGVPGVAFAVLFLAGLVLSIVVAGGVPFPSPFGPEADILAYFRDRQDAVRVAALLQLAAVVPLALYTSAVTGRVRGYAAAVGGGLAAAFLAVSALVSWVLSRPEVVGDAVVVRALHDLSFITGGPGHVVPLGLLVAGIATGARLPRWLRTAGLAIATAAGLSLFTLLLPEAAYLLPIARFTGLVWLVAVGFLLSRNDRDERSTTS